MASYSQETPENEPSQGDTAPSPQADELRSEGPEPSADAGPPAEAPAADTPAAEASAAEAAGAAPSEAPPSAETAPVAEAPSDGSAAAAPAAEEASPAPGPEAHEAEPAAAQPADVTEHAAHVEHPTSADAAHPAEEADDGQRPLVCVRYGRMNILGLFRTTLEHIPAHSRVVIKSDRGLELGVALCPANKQMSYEGKPLKRVGSIRRLATSDDLMEERHLHQGELRERDFCRQKIKEHNLPMHLAAVEHLFGGDRIVFYFLADGRVDFRDLVKDLAHEYQTRIEMRQIGVRDEARLLADFERCGQEVCCRMFIKEFQPVSMRMAKLQKATLDPSKISGRCGRLMCCLRFEFETYEILRKRLPKKNSYVMTEDGPGKVVNADVLTQLVKLETNGQSRIVAVEEITERNVTEEQVAEWTRQNAAQRETRFRGSRTSRPRPGRPAEAGRPSQEARAGSPAPEGRTDGQQAEVAEGQATPPRGDGDSSSQRRGRRSRGGRRKRKPAAGSPTGQGGAPQGGAGRDAGRPAADRRGKGVPAEVLRSLGVEDDSGPPRQDAGPDRPAGADGQGGDGRSGQRPPNGEPRKKRRRGRRSRRRSKRPADGDSQGGESGPPQAASD